jgi:predicted transposase/invertase (TIGR01784 family)
MAELLNPHDRFFKEVFSRQDVARDFLQHYLPTDVVASFDLSTLETIKDTFIDQELQSHFSDLLYRVSLHDSGHNIYVYVLFEHKSYPDSLIAFQLLRYMVRVWEHTLKQHQRLAPILPVVIYHGPTLWKIPSNFHALFEVSAVLHSFVPDYSYWLCDLSQYSDEEIKGAVILRVTLLLLKYVMHDNLREQLPGILSLLGQLSEQQTGLEYLETALRYLSGGTDKIDHEDLRKAVEAAFSDGGTVMSTIAEKWIEQGIQQGIQQEILSSIELGLELKFGVEGLQLLPEIRKIEDVDVLRAIREGLKIATTLDELRLIYRPAQEKGE